MKFFNIYIQITASIYVTVCNGVHFLQNMTLRTDGGTFFDYSDKDTVFPDLGVKIRNENEEIKMAVTNPLGNQTRPTIILLIGFTLILQWGCSSSDPSNTFEATNDSDVTESSDLDNTDDLDSIDTIDNTEDIDNTDDTESNDKMVENETDNPEDAFWESDDFDECAAVNETAKNEYQPLDIIFTIDNTPSMLDEINEVRANMNLFSERIIESGLDANIILVSCLPGDCMNNKFHGICIDAPLGAQDGCVGDEPYEDTNLPQYLHVSTRVASVKGLGITVNTFEDWKSMLRANSKKHFVIVSDDTDETSAEAFNEAVLQLDADLFVDYQFNGIFAYTSKDTACAIDDTEPCCTYAAPEGNTDSWEPVYADLVASTGGVSGDLCLQDFDPVFDELAQSVIASAELSCEWEIPEPPDGETLDPARVNIDFVTKDDMELIGNIESSDMCKDVEKAWYYDDPENPKKIMVCPTTCDWIRGFENAQIVLQFGCETETIIVK